MKNRYRIIVHCLFACLVLLGGCGKGKELKTGGTYIYYINTDGTGLIKDEYEIVGDSAEDEVRNILKEMQKKPDSIDYNSAFPTGVSVDKWELNDGGLYLYFSANYEDIDAASEVLLRAAVVKTLVQIAGVDYLDFFVADQPLTDSEGKEIGHMRDEDFIQNTGSSLHSYQLGNLDLYFANAKGDKLVKEEVSVRYNSNMSVEKLIVEQLIKGPSTDRAYPTIPAETKLLGVSVKDGICYVNFDEEFLDVTYKIDPKMTIYSVVNSIIEGGEASQVQILVNGETDITYQGSVDLSKPFSRDLDIMEAEEEN